MGHAGDLDTGGDAGHAGHCLSSRLAVGADVPHVDEVLSQPDDVGQ